ncbi:bromodomain-containing protein [Ditylenchus destructor]|nr:bromodomain-containing protein [Ditylenchus destructor]
MSDREWLKSNLMMEDDDSGEEEEEPKRKKPRKNNGDEGGESTSVKRGRKKKVVAEGAEGSDEEDRTKAKKKRVAADPNNKLTEMLQKLYQTLVTYRTSDGRELAYPFIQLPSRRELPDYYEVIEKPMDLNRIKKKIKDGRYNSLDDMTEDVRLMCSNAQKYNTDGSEIFNDSIILERVWDRVLETHKSSNVPSTSQSSSTNQPKETSAADSKESDEPPADSAAVVSDEDEKA